jgi:hypothetical protein
VSWSEDSLHRFTRARLGSARSSRRVGNDAAVLRAELPRPVLCVDQTIEGVHFASGTSAWAWCRTSARCTLTRNGAGSIWATRWGNSLFARRHPDASVAVSSEPWDDDAAWFEVPDGSVLRATPASVEVADLA